MAAGGTVRKAGRADWFFVSSVLVALSLIVGVGIFVSLFVLNEVIQAIARS